jgi:hypothetical protein
LEHRTGQGHLVAMISNSHSPEEIRRQIRQLAKAGGLRFVVLVGDAEPMVPQESEFIAPSSGRPAGLGGSPIQGELASLRTRKPGYDPALKARCVPMALAKAKVNVSWGSEPLLATDNWYADLDDDQIPELAVGRLTAGSPEELQQIVAKTLAYERSRDFGPWRRRLNFVAGVGGFGPLADMVLESAARYFLTQNISAGYQVSMTYASWHSPYCPDPRQFHSTTLQRLNEGSWFWVYLGHGHPLGLDRLRVPGGEYPIFSAQDVPKLNCPHAAPIALFLSCYAGAIDMHADCLAKQMLRQPGGPVAVVAGSRVTMPYAMSVLAVGLMDEVFRKRCPTLGEALLHAKQSMVKEPAEADRQRAMLDSIAAAISPAPQQLAAERAEHVLLFNLVGDPLLRLRYPQEIKLTVASSAAAGRPLRLSGTCPIDGRGTIELLLHRGRLTFKPPQRRDYPQAPGALAEFQEVYHRANDLRLAAAEMPLHAGRFEVSLDVPPEASGECHVAVFVEGEDDFAMGTADVKLQQ